jgi:enoyl-CoA hydratase
LERPEGGLVLLRLERASRMNAMDVPAMRQLKATLDELAADRSVRVLVITGQGRGFCAGLDLKSVLDEQGHYGLDATASYELQMVFDSVMRRLRSMDAAVIAAVNGVAVGAGMGLSLCADIRFASRSASFHVGAVKVGLSAGECGISYHLPRLIGAGRAFELMLTGRPVDAQEAERIGLISKVVDDDKLQETALQVAINLTKASPSAIRWTKLSMNNWLNQAWPIFENSLALEILGFSGPDVVEGLKAYDEKRQPVFNPDCPI